MIIAALSQSLHVFTMTAVSQDRVIAICELPSQLLTKSEGEAGFTYQPRGSFNDGGECKIGHSYMMIHLTTTLLSDGSSSPIAIVG